MGNPGCDLPDQLVAPACALGEALAQADEVHFPLLVGSVVKGAEPGVGLGHHVEPEPRPVRLPVPVPVRELVLANALDRLAEASGHGVGQLIAERVDLFIEWGEVDLAGAEQGLALGALLPLLEFPVNNAACLVEPSIRQPAETIRRSDHEHARESRCRCR